MLKRTCWTRSRNDNCPILCAVCFCYQSSQLYLTDYCCSKLTTHVTRQVCDTCLHQHVVAKLHSCLTSCIACPEIDCRATLSQSVICHVLLKNESHALLDDYLRELQWQGKNDEWIRRFATRCPGCQVPIEKNGGCDEMLCIHCQTHFYWSKAKGCHGRIEVPHHRFNPCFPSYNCYLILFIVVILTSVFMRYFDRK